MLFINNNMFNWHSDILSALDNGNYNSVVTFYENLAESNSRDLSIFWYLGLALLLEGHEEDAQATWVLAMSNLENDDEIFNETLNLITILKTESFRQKNQNNLFAYHLILQHIQDLRYDDLDNLFELIKVDIQLQNLLYKKEYIQEACNLISNKNIIINQEKALDILRLVLFFPSQESLSFAETCLLFLNSQEVVLNILIEVAVNLGYYHNLPLFSIQLAELCLKYKPGYLKALENLPRLYLLTRDYPKAINSAKEFCLHCKTIDLQFFSNSLLLKALLSSGSWSELKPVAIKQKELFDIILNSQNIKLSIPIIKSLVVFAAFLFYLEDNIQENRRIQNKASKLFINEVKYDFSKKILRQKHSKTKKLKIGYIAHTLKSHSVGWLSRWLFKYHDRENFDFSIYLMAQSSDDSFFKSWFYRNVDHVYSFLSDVPSAVQQIYDDEIDILIDLDGTTLDDTLMVMSFKPAPIQVTWLGSDASGLSSIDYFIADPYVLSAEADIYYQEKIWRLPQTYIAIDGFESDVPTLRRKDLNIPEDAIIYLSSQVGMKRHPETIKMQFDILKEVTNSYFLIKGLSDDTTIQDIFLKFAKQTDVDPSRLRFLPLMETEYIHRANLCLADVILDTYPYNGATTTLEALWAGVPIVTRVGQQFAARNTYAFLMNIGVTEGIAWTEKEYVEWGIRFGQDTQLRQQVVWKLKQSRHTSSLWNAKQFTRDMENAYRQMWEIYIAT